MTARVILGTMTFAGQTCKADVATMLRAFVQADVATPGGSVAQIDTARLYNAGKTEALIGELCAEDPALAQRLAVATKAHPFMGAVLDTAGVDGQLGGSLGALGTKRVDLFYLHGPCAQTPIAETLAAVQKHFEAGRFARFGLSNFTAWETVYIHGYMTQRGWVVPTVYQGMYNAITRAVEGELFPALRRLGMAFYAYNPLAGGMLTGKYARTAPATLSAGRFDGSTPWGKVYQQRFMQGVQFDAVEVVRVACAAAGDGGGGGIPLPEAALRWALHHSLLKEQDGLILGASSCQHFESNLAACAKGPLPAAVVEAYNEAAKMCAGVCPSFSRGYSGSASQS